jgi:hypothetical protein
MMSVISVVGECASLACLAYGAWLAVVSQLDGAQQSNEAPNADSTAAADDRIAREFDPISINPD